METTRRNVLRSALFGAGYIGLRALATGLPVKLLLNPRKALADNPTCDTSKAQYFILSTSAGGDPIGSNAPGMYLDPDIVHPDPIANPGMAPTQLSILGKSYTAAKPWSTLSRQVLDRTCFWNLMTNTPVHPKEPQALRLMDAIQPAEMFPSLLGKLMAPCLGTIQKQPVSLATPLTFDGGALPVIKPKALQATLLTPAGKLTKDLQPLRDQSLNALYDIYKNEATTAQRKYIDSLVTSTEQVRGIEQSLVEKLAMIEDDDIGSQITAAVTLIQMRVSPVVVINIPFGRDNHTDPGLALEVAENISGVAAIANLMAQIDQAGVDTPELKDKITFATLNVFGRTMYRGNPTNNNGRGHNQYHQMSVTISSALKGGVIGGVHRVSNEFGCTPIDSATGAAAPDGGDINSLDTLASFGKTVLSSVGVDSATVEKLIPSGKVINAAVA